jgi:D-glycero-beta-D-manno-heptose-7-phosphate kinase
MITKEELKMVLQQAEGLSAVVIGDVMMDKYVYGSVERISPEAPVPIVNLHHTDIKAGGAANVAVNLAAWGCKTALIGIVGKDENAKILTSLLDQKNIQQGWIISPDRPTTVKTRIVASSHHLLRIDEESSAYLTGEEEKIAIENIHSHLLRFNPQLVIIEDYNKGLLTEKVIASILEYCRMHKVYVAVDPKEKNFFSYHSANLFKPNLREASEAQHQSLRVEDLEGVCREWQKNQDIGTVAITLGSQGVFIQDHLGGHHVKPDRSIDVVDVCGAGDAVICALALGLSTGLNAEKSGSLGNLAGAYVCSHSGVVAVNVDEIYQWI